MVSENDRIPPAAIVSGVLLLINTTLVILFFKELRLSTFDAGLAGSVGVNPNWIQVALMAITAATLVSAFESVGAILVISMLVVPAATARLLTDRLATMLVLSLLIAAMSATLGHVSAMTLPSMLFSRLGYPDIRDASTTGMMSVASGGLFVAAIVFSPRHGWIRRVVDQIRLQVRIAGEDILGSLYRRDEEWLAEHQTDVPSISRHESTKARSRNWMVMIAQWRLYRRGLVTVPSNTIQLTNRGREKARSLVRSHRLWETYMARHFELPGDHLHATAEQVEHYLSSELQTELAAELDQPSIDPHGKMIPPHQ